jgi:hypothetical protein
MVVLYIPDREATRSLERSGIADDGRIVLVASSPSRRSRGLTRAETPFSSLRAAACRRPGPTLRGRAVGSRWRSVRSSRPSRSCAAIARSRTSASWHTATSGASTTLSSTTASGSRCHPGQSRRTSAAWCTSSGYRKETQPERAMAMTALGRACVRGGTNTGPLGSSLESRTTKRVVDVGFQVIPPSRTGRKGRRHLPGPLQLEATYPLVA